MRTKNLLQVSAMCSASSRITSITTKSYTSTILHMTSGGHKTCSTHTCMLMWWSSHTRTLRTLRTLTPTGIPESLVYFTSMSDMLAQKDKIQHPNASIFSGYDGLHTIEMSSLAGPCTIFCAFVSTLKVSLRHLASGHHLQCACDSSLLLWLYEKLATIINCVQQVQECQRLGLVHCEYVSTDNPLMAV